LIRACAGGGRCLADATRIYTLPTDDDLDAAIARLTVDR
jgi:hypothetical protein